VDPVFVISGHAKVTLVNADGFLVFEQDIDVFFLNFLQDL
jgi:hypothetical protein